MLGDVSLHIKQFLDTSWQVGSLWQKSQTWISIFTRHNARKPCLYASAYHFMKSAMFTPTGLERSILTAHHFIKSAMLTPTGLECSTSTFHFLQYHWFEKNTSKMPNQKYALSSNYIYRINLPLLHIVVASRNRKWKTTTFPGYLSSTDTCRPKTLLQQQKRESQAETSAHQV